MATTLDHISNGRAVLGIGGAWFETEHEGLGLEFGGSPGERLRWLDEAVQIMRGMLHGERPSGSKYYATKEALNLPPPVQATAADPRRRRWGAAARYGPWRSTRTRAMSAAASRA